MREKRWEQRAEEDEMWDNDGSFSGRLNLSCCYCEENGIVEQQRASVDRTGVPGVGAVSQEGQQQWAVSKITPQTS